MSELALNLLVLKTRQLESLLAFYQALGIAFVKEQHGNGPVHYAGRVGDTVFELYQGSEDGSVENAIRLGFIVPMLTDAIEVLRSIGAPVVTEPKASEWGLRAVVRDPDGRAVELYQR